MKGKKIGFNDEVKAPQHTAESSGQLDVTAKERFATGTNNTSRHKSKAKPYGKLGGKGIPG